MNWRTITGCVLLTLLVPCRTEAEIIAYVDNPDSATNVDRPFVALLAASDWFAAEKEANRWGGHLIAIRDQAMNDWVHATFANADTTPRALWIGYNDIAQEGQFEWTDGTMSTFTNWKNSEPNNTGGNEDSVLMLPDGSWNDAEGTLPIAFGVAVVAAIPEASTLSAVGAICLILGAMRVRRGAMQVHRLRRTPSDARSTGE